MKTAEEIKIGMECCEKYMNGAPEEECCHVCNYIYNCAELKLDALAYIKVLEADVEKLMGMLQDAEKANAKEVAKQLDKIVNGRCWIPVEERLPENDVPVLVSAKRKGWNGKEYSVVFMAFHTDGTTHTEDSGCDWNLEDTGLKYCEETDDYIIPEAWWEDVRYGEEFSKVYDTYVTHWMPLPEVPKEE